MAISRDRLYQSLTAAGLPVVGGALVTMRHAVSGFATWHDRPEGLLRLDWSVRPSPAQESQANAVVQAHDGTPTAGERLDAVTQRPRVQAALVLRASTQWGSLTPARRALVQQVLDDAAADLVALLG